MRQLDPQMEPNRILRIGSHPKKLLECPMSIHHTIFQSKTRKEMPIRPIWSLQSSLFFLPLVLPLLLPLPVAVSRCRFAGLLRVWNSE